MSWRELARAREEFLTSRTTPTGVRLEIVKSWRRSAMVGAQPEGAPSFGDVDVDSYLYGVAAPVLDRLSERLADSRTAMLLANRDARIVGRWAGDHGVLRMMDLTGSAPGFALHEEAVGTNGLGSVIEEQRPLYVVGHEHFAKQFVGYACFGVPIHHPVLRRIEGVLTLVCKADEASPLMLPFVRQVSDSIQDRMFVRATGRERILLDSFSAAVRRQRHAIMAVSEHTVICSPAASRLLDASDHAIVWEAAADATQSRRRSESEVTLKSGRGVRARFTPVEFGTEVAGALVEFETLDVATEGSPRRAHAARAASPDEELSQHLRGRSSTWRSVLREIAPVLRSCEPVLVSGPAGSGKTRVARVIHELSGRSGRLATLDAAMLPVDGTSSWLRAARQAFEDSDALLIRHLNLLDDTAGSAVMALADAHDDQSPRLLATATLDRDVIEPRARVIERFAVHEIAIPRLMDRAEDVPELVEQILTDIGHAGLEFAPEAMQALLRAPWPGNVRQLERVLRALAGTRTSGVVRLSDLPSDLLRSPRRAGGQLEEVERRAIVRALDDADGNKTAAAAELGISRSTLYRKLRSFGSDLDRTTF
ncbi:MAG: sigma 54-interacting transcriptional regulator [Actinobacteria bacterium]|nr:sigma 54-interacting transcriptional regulator [Actinomycetota bacterium]